MNDENCVLFVGNISEKVTEEILYELFLQAGPVKTVCIPKDHKTGRQRNFGFVTFKHDVSVQYSIELMNDTKLYNSCIKLNVKHGNRNGNEDNQTRNAPEGQYFHNERMSDNVMVQMNGEVSRPFHHQMVPPHMRMIQQQQQPDLRMKLGNFGSQEAHSDFYHMQRNPTRQQSYHGHEEFPEDVPNTFHGRRKLNRDMHRSVSGPNMCQDRDYRSEGIRKGHHHSNGHRPRHAPYRRR